MHGIYGERRNSEFHNRPILTKVQQFLISIPRDYYSVKNIEILKTLVKEKQALLVDVREPEEDVREPEEYASEHIKGAINISGSAKKERMNAWVKKHCNDE